MAFAAESQIPARPASLDPRAFKFLCAILVVSLAPIALLALMPWQVHEYRPPLVDIINVLILVNVMHVGTTGLIWVDRRYRDHVARRPVFFYVLPAIVAAVSIGAVLGLGKIGTVAVTTLNTIWLLYHFTKQNWGLLCLSAAATRSARPARIQKFLYVFAVAGGTIGALGGAFDTLSLHATVLAGAAVVGAVGVASIAFVIREIAARAHPFHVLFTAFVGFYFAPLYLFDITTGMMVISTAHSFQYMVIMSALAGDRRQGALWPRLLSLVLLGGAVAAVYAVFNYGALWGERADLLMVAYLCISMWHFIVDADVWRLSQPFQRQALKESLPFLFR